VSHGQNVTVDVLIGSKCHSGRSELGRNVQAAISLFPAAARQQRHSPLPEKVPHSLPDIRIAPFYLFINDFSPLFALQKYSSL
jgi:hypothetical protein